MSAQHDASVQIVDRPAAERYEALVEGAIAGFLEYRRGPARLLLRHTEVDPAFEGRGIGSALARRAVDDARAAGLTVIVVCPFVRAWLARHPEDAAGIIVRGA
jgi:predicted GNAT family acetyltransferase